MRAMRFEAPNAPLRLVRLARPQPGPEQILIKIGACGVCRTDLHLVDGELPDPKIPVIPGHEIESSVQDLDAVRNGRKYGVQDIMLVGQGLFGLFP